MNTELSARLLRRDGRCSDLALELWVAGELSTEERLALEAHFEQHPDDLARAEAIQRHQDRVTLSPPEAKVLRFPFWVTGTLAAALAAALTLIVIRGPANTVTTPTVDDGIRIKAGALDFEVFAHDGESSRPVTDGGAVKAGERIGFRLKARHEGYVLVAGVDEAGAPYPCWPAGDAPEGARWTEKEPVKLDQAMRLDNTPGSERFVAVFCPQPVKFTEVSTALVKARADQWKGDVPLSEGCVSRVVRLEKQK
ncbi:MAG: hypothetical protein ACE366_02740 [Bradymonadia bacterium]